MISLKNNACIIIQSLYNNYINQATRKNEMNPITEQVLKLIAQRKMLEAQTLFNDNIELFGDKKHDALFNMLDHDFSSEAK